MLEPAMSADSRALHRLRRGLADWPHSRGIDQWIPGEVREDEIADQITRSEWHVLRNGAGIDAALHFLRTDREIWSDDASARYVHGLMVDRAALSRRAGHGAHSFRQNCHEPPAMRLVG